MSEITLYGSLLAIASAPAFIYLWHEARRKKEESLKKAKVVARRRQYHD
ncbi:MAG: hypothetical protein ACI9EW_002316 [Cellvibrionaceae bacterium]|jgi:hypothetical protein